MNQTPKTAAPETPKAKARRPEECRPHRFAAKYERDIAAIAAECSWLDAQWLLRDNEQERRNAIRLGQGILNNG